MSGGRYTDEWESLTSVTMASMDMSDIGHDESYHPEDKLELPESSNPHGDLL